MMPVIFKSIAAIILLLLTFTHCKEDIPSTVQTKEVKQISEQQIATDSTHTTEYLTGHFDPSSHFLFTEIEAKYADREGMYMRNAAYVSFQKMWEAAKKDGVELQIRSAARNFDYQKGIWERKWTGATILSDGINASEISDEKERALKILLYSSMPGTSRHHWGTDIDLNSFDNQWFESGDGLHLYNWLLNNASSYGFCQVYTAKNKERPNGYEEEKWHWSYSPISKPLTKFAQTTLKNEMIKGFKGAETSIKIDVVKKYVLGIHPSCLH